MHLSRIGLLCGEGDVVGFDHATCSAIGDMSALPFAVFYHVGGDLGDKNFVCAGSSFRQSNCSSRRIRLFSSGKQIRLFGSGSYQVPLFKERRAFFIQFGAFLLTLAIKNLKHLFVAGPRRISRRLDHTTHDLGPPFLTKPADTNLQSRVGYFRYWCALFAHYFQYPSLGEALHSILDSLLRKRVNLIHSLLNPDEVFLGERLCGRDHRDGLDLLVFGDLLRVGKTFRYRF